MSFIAILLSLVIERVVDNLHRMRPFGWFVSFADWVYARLEGQRFRNGPLGVLLVVGPVVAAAWILQGFFADMAWVFGLLFSLVVLLYCLGPRDLEEDVAAYKLAVERNDQEGALLHACDMLGHPVSQQPAELAETVKATIFTAVDERVLGVFFWFVVLGPVGAVLFRFSSVLRRYARQQDSGLAPAAENLYLIMLWPTARLTVIAYAFAGSFVETIAHCRPGPAYWQLDSEPLLRAGGFGALQQDFPPEPPAADAAPDMHGVAQALLLVQRAVIIWIGVFAALTIVGWMV